MFLDYLHSDKKTISTQCNYVNASVRMPQIIMLIGKFEEKEINCFKRNLKENFPVDSHVFWIDEENTNFSSDLEKSFLEQRLEFSNYINEKSFHSFCEKTVADVFNSTANLNCQEPGAIYFSAVCKAEQPTSGLLIPAIRKMKELLLDQFGIVYTDLYLLLDQSAYQEQKLEKESALYLSILEAEQLVKDKILRLAYVMSNMDSKGRLRDRTQVYEEAYAAIALMISMKNRIPDNSAYRYSDTDFGKSVFNLAQSKATESGLLASIGHMRLQTDKEFNALATYLAVWNKLADETDETKLENLLCELGMGKSQISQCFASLYKTINVNAADFETIVRNRNIEEKSVYTMKNGDAISKFFGNNLDLYCKLNVQNHNIQQYINNWCDTLNQKISGLPSDISNIDIEKLLKKIEDNLRCLVDESDELLENEKNKLSKWELTLFANNAGKEVNPLFGLASAYIRMRNNLYKEEQKKQLYEELLEKVADLNIHYQNYEMLVGETIESIEAALKEKEMDAVKPGNGSSLLQITNAKKYYRDVTTELLAEKNCAKDFRQLSDELKKMVSNKSFNQEKVYKLVMDFCEKSVFTNLIFNTNFLEELQTRLIGYEDEGKWEIKTDTDVSNFLLTSIIDAQHTLYYDAIHQGFETYEEMCLCLRDDSIFMKEKDRDAHVANVIRDQKMKLFCDKNSNSLDVVFVAGNLKSQNLYKWKNYKSSYEKLMENT